MSFNWPADDLTVKEKVGIGTDTPSERLEVKGNLKLNTGVAVGEFSSDGTFATPSNQSVPTTQAVKTYVDTQVSTVNTGLATKADKGGSLAQNFQANNLTAQGNVGVGITNPEAPLHVVGKLLGAAQDTSGNALRICCGTTPEGRTAWQVYSDAGVFVDVDTSMCRFTNTPIYIVSMHGNGYNWETTGGSSAYSRTATSFRVYVRFSDGRQFTPDFAQAQGWHIQWIAIGN